MSRLRIVCKGEPFRPSIPMPEVGYAIGAMPAVWHDIELTLVADDGTEHAITNVTRVVWSAEQGQMATARLDFDDVDVELEADFGVRDVLARDAVVEAARAWARGDEGALTGLMQAVERVGP